MTVYEHLGLTLSSNFLASAYFENSSKASKKLNLLKPLKYNLSCSTLKVLFKSLVHSSLEFADVVWNGCPESDSDLLESLQIEGARNVTDALKGRNRIYLLNERSWVDLSVRKKIHKLSLMYKMVFKLHVAPPYLCDLCPDFRL